MSGLLETLLIYKAAIVFGWLALFFVAERLAPAADTERGWFGDWPRLVRNGILWLIAAGVSLALVVPVTVFAAAHPVWTRPDWWGGWHGLLLDLLLLDLWIYWWHRANHRIPVLWRFHRVHHLDRFLDVTTAQRFHFGEVALSAAARAAVIVLLAVPLTSVLLFELLIALSTGFHHSNLRLPAALERLLSRLVVTPSIHWVHHHRVRRDTDSNYATVLSVWDRLFGSRSRTRRSADMEIGVEGAEERPAVGLLLDPFEAARPPV
jgi:sterol desaturase/sphingolipid hydroxylase (fatty acid hydroxylase superfamily)